MKQEKTCGNCMYYDSYANHTDFESKSEYGECTLKFPCWVLVGGDSEVRRFSSCSFWKERDDERQNKG